MVDDFISRVETILLPLDIDVERTVLFCAVASLTLATTYLLGGPMGVLLIGALLLALYCPFLVVLPGTRRPRVDRGETLRFRVAAKLITPKNTTASARAMSGVLGVTSRRLLFESRSLETSIELAEITGLEYHRALGGTISLLRVKTGSSSIKLEVRNPRILCAELRRTTGIALETRRGD